MKWCWYFIWSDCLLESHLIDSKLYSVRRLSRAQSSLRMCHVWICSPFSENITDFSTICGFCSVCIHPRFSVWYFNLNPFNHSPFLRVVLFIVILVDVTDIYIGVRRVCPIYDLHGQTNVFRGWTVDGRWFGSEYGIWNFRTRERPDHFDSCLPSSVPNIQLLLALVAVGTSTSRLYAVEEYFGTVVLSACARSKWEETEKDGKKNDEKTLARSFLVVR